jgi:hypothetical protein
MSVGGTTELEWPKLPSRLWAALQIPGGDWRPLAEKLSRQRLQPLARHLAARGKLPAVRRLIVLPSAALRGLPLEVLAPGYTLSYAPSGTLFAHLQQRPRPTGKGLLALADPVFARPTPAAPAAPLPPGGVLVRLVGPGSVAARARLRPGDVLLKYADAEVNTPAELGKRVAAHAGAKQVSVTLWRQGKTATRFVGPGPLGVVLDRRPAPQALRDKYQTDRWLASTRGGGRWQALPGTRAEAEGIARLFAARHATLLTDSAASEQELDILARSGALARFRFLHLASHGSTDDRWPLRSALILARDTLPDAGKQLEAGLPVYDGKLTAEEVLRSWRLDCALVTLSACQSGLGVYEQGEGHVGFAQAFLLAGSRSVCLSLWKVDDAATALLMHRFYANLLGRRPGLSKPLPRAEALAEAKEWLRGLSREEALKQAAGLMAGVTRGKGRKRLPLLPELPRAGETGGKGERPYAHPYYWAAFVLVGNPD